jgi:fumarylacetoacetate (FAA) hydrolase family protein
MTTAHPSPLFQPAYALPDDLYAGTLVARIWNPAGVGGPSVAVLRANGVYDLSAQVATMSSLLESEDPVALVRQSAGQFVGTLEAVLANSEEGDDDVGRNPSQPFFLAPCDLQVVKAAGVTFAASMIERVIEEKAGGDASRAQAIRSQVLAQIGSDLSAIKPGSAQALQLKAALQAQGIWSQYLEVGIGKDAEVFTKAAWSASAPTRTGTIPSRRWCWRSTAVVSSRAPRWATTSTCATSKGAARSCWARPRTTTPRAPSALSSACLMTASGWTRCAAR